MTVDILTFGCRLNTYESEVMRGHAAALENTIIVNTCAVTAEAVRQARQTIRRARKENPTARVIVTGCAAQTEAENFARMPEVDQVLGNADKLGNLTAYRLSSSSKLINRGMAIPSFLASTITLDFFGEKTPGGRLDIGVPKVPVI